MTETNINTTLSNNEEAPIFMLVAGELSGDLLGGGLIKAIKEIYPKAQFFGIGGLNMIQEGLESIEPIETLSIMGLVEILKDLPRLFKVKKTLVEEAIKRKPICFIGIDAPDFNLRLAKDLKKLQITTFQYVSPSVWVWREGRVKTIRRNIDRVLCLFPFEVDFYKKHQVDSVCVGHRLGDEIPLETDMAVARMHLDLDQEAQYLAMLPGSRRGEISRLLPFFLDSAPLILEDYPNLEFLIPAATQKIKELIEEAIAQLPAILQNKIHLFQGQSREVMSAADSVLLASGTAALEAMLLKKPMVVCYRFSGFTAWLAPKIVNITHFSLPNILSKEVLVTELFQKEVTPENIRKEINLTLEDSEENQQKLLKFRALHESLRLNSDIAARDAVISLLKEKGVL
ncbi:lipid-A-disaccharide synthase [Ignatzschineria sp. LJL83]